MSSQDDRAAGGAPSATAPPRRAGLLLTAVCVAVVLVVASVSSLNVALPSIGADLRASQSSLTWIIDAYAIVLAALLLPAGALGDRFGRKKLMVGGLVVMAVAAIGSIGADSASVLIAARAIGGVGAAMVFPGTLSTITNVFPPHERGRAVGLWAASAATGGILGVLASGVLIESFDFSSIFVATAIATVATLVLTIMVVPETSDPEHAHLDPLGSLTSVIGIGGLVLAIFEGPVEGWTAPVTVVGFVAAVVGLGGFVVWELRTARPILDVRLFRNRGFATGSLSVFLQFFGAFGFFFLSAQLLGYVYGYGPLTTGLALMPISLAIAPLSATAPRLAHRFGRGPVGGVGLGLLGAALAIFAFIDVGASYWHFVLGLLAFGAGMGLAATPATEAIVESLPLAQQGVASAVNDVSRELGGALGIAVLGTIFNLAYRAGIDDRATQIPPALLAQVRDSPAAAFGVAERAGPAGGGIIAAVRDAFVSGHATAMFVGAGVLVLAGIVVAARAPRTALAPVPLQAHLIDPTVEAPA